ncbi:hypothetical protein BCR34DRAFT_171611 [Clohesyomyces aquaticus]|uniref:Uncharacterized protein n=1 Tax=Clohesyomyces aquaticus TaxID=1231657 RepID=A0A1Y1ZZL7_9PLEO|nr:hypothetical protein BCR34DRAFT_171611 [Clohesyomyces aquaticus]
MDRKAQLYALLSKDKAHPNDFGRTEAHIRLWQKHQAAASEILRQCNDQDLEVFPFMALPPELRFMVYQELLVTDDRLLLNWRGPKKATKQQKRMYIAILMTSKICSQEGLGVLYGENVFDFEEICGRPSFATSFVKRLNPTNLSLIRIIVADYSAASEELALYPGQASNQLSIARISSFLAPFNIKLSQLRCFAISIIPYGFDNATTYVMKLQAPALQATGQQIIGMRRQWLDTKNEGLDEAAKRIVEREAELKRVEFRDVEKNICFDWIPLFINRPWLVYVKGR